MALTTHLLLAISLLAAGADVRPADVARDLFEQATAEYETSEYSGAIEKYTKAYELSSSIKDEKLKARVQAAILFNLARAHSKAYALDGKREHLLQAEDLLQKYLKQTADLKNEDDARLFLDETQVELKRLEEEEAARREEEEQRRAALEAQKKEELASREPEAEQDDGRGLIIGGVTLIGLGVVGAGVSVVGGILGEQANDEYLAGPTRDDRDSAERKGRTGNVLLVSGAAAGGVFLTTGVVLALVGRSRAKAAGMKTSGFLTPGGGGLVIGGEF